MPATMFASKILDDALATGQNQAHNQLVRSIYPPKEWIAGSACFVTERSGPPRSRYRYSLAEKIPQRLISSWEPLLLTKKKLEAKSRLSCE